MCLHVLRSCATASASERALVRAKRAYPVQTQDALHEEFVITLFEKSSNRLIKRDSYRHRHPALVVAG